MLDVDAAQGADAFREDERLRLTKRRGREPTPIAFVHDWRVEALLDRGPDAERGSEVEAVNH